MDLSIASSVQNDAQYTHQERDKICPTNGFGCDGQCLLSNNIVWTFRTHDGVEPPCIILCLDAALGSDYLLLILLTMDLKPPRSFLGLHTPIGLITDTTTVCFLRAIYMLPYYGEGAYMHSSHTPRWARNTLYPHTFTHYIRPWLLLYVPLRSFRCTFKYGWIVYQLISKVDMLGGV